MRRVIARALRRIAQKLSPIHTDSQIRDLRAYYDNHCSVTGEPVQKRQLNFNINVPPGAEQTFRDIQRQYQDIEYTPLTRTYL